MNLETVKLINSYKAIIKDLKKNWGANCEDVDENWAQDGGCMSCRAQKVIEFLQETIETIKENA